MKKYLNEVESAFLLKRPRAGAHKWLAEDYVGGGESKLEYLNMKIPEVRTVFRKGFSFSALSSAEQWEIWDYIWKNSRYFEVMLMSSYWVAGRPVEELHTHRKTLLSWIDRVDNWGHSDELSGLYARLVEYNPGTMLPVLKRWNKSRYPWMRRQSVVGLMFYSRFRKKYPEGDLILKLVENLLDDDHYYVQKGVGWALRECWNVYPQTCYAFLLKHAHRIAPGGWTAATEKLSVAEKKKLSDLRKRNQRKV